VVDQTAQAVLRIDPTTGDQTAVVTNPPNSFECSNSLQSPEDLTMAPGGTLFMSDTLCVNRAVLPAGTISEVLFDLGVGILTGITTDPGGDLLVTDSTSDAV